MADKLNDAILAESESAEEIPKQRKKPGPKPKPKTEAKQEPDSATADSDTEVAESEEATEPEADSTQKAQDKVEAVPALNSDESAKISNSDEVVTNFSTQTVSEEDTSIEQADFDLPKVEEDMKIFRCYAAPMYRTPNGQGFISYVRSGYVLESANSQGFIHVLANVPGSGKVSGYISNQYLHF